MSQLFGWVPMPAESEAFIASLPKPMFAQAANALTDSGKGKVVLLHEHLAKLMGMFPIHTQEIGDCVSHGWGLSIDILKAVEILVRGDKEQFLAQTATEFLYHTGRVDIGRGQLGNEDGSLGSWQAKAVQQFGVVPRLKFGDIDLAQYSGQRAKQWGAPQAAIPSEVDAKGREHPVQTVALVTSYTEARDAIANGYPVPVCSMQGFADKRDSEGFARAQGQWAHCMAFIAVDDAHRRPGLLCMNSWGANWITGPKRHNQPDGSFWVDADVCDRMLKQRDSYAVSNFKGYPARELPETWLC